MLALRRVTGDSMLPAYPPGKVLLVRRLHKNSRLRPGQVVMIRHNGLDKLKRLHAVEGGRIYVLGDNPLASTDSRHFGWLPAEAVQGVVIEPRFWLGLGRQASASCSR